mmetsp:Transcript_1735/g.6177  ORF Transcript_1735/g.6177 Transcript_1735/m.6177 type:complete len:219 (+) Transcript_1735:558-1214(+)
MGAVLPGAGDPRVPQPEHCQPAVSHWQGFLQCSGRCCPGQGRAMDRELPPRNSRRLLRLQWQWGGPGSPGQHQGCPRDSVHSVPCHGELQQHHQRAQRRPLHHHPVRRARGWRLLADAHRYRALLQTLQPLWQRLLRGPLLSISLQAENVWRGELCDSGSSPSLAEGLLRCRCTPALPPPEQEHEARQRHDEALHNDLREGEGLREACALHAEVHTLL